MSEPAQGASGSAAQSAHYDAILDAYERHYFDGPSMAYRDEFIYRPLFAGLDMNGWRVADLAAGSGYNSLALLERFPDAEVTGFDISESACKRYEVVVGRPAVQADLTRSADAGEAFDAALIIGGLHHCATDLPATLATIAGLLKPGGRLLMFEPNRHYVLEGARKLWYRLDRYFEASSEAALDHDDLVRMASPKFAPEMVRYFGGPAFFLVYNSLVFRIPPAVKPALAGPLMAAERAYNALPGRWPFSSFVARWIRAGDG